MPFSFHSHSGQFCSHAHGTLEQVVQCAIARGFRVYGLSEHQPRNETCHLYQEEIESGITPSDLNTTFDRFVCEARRLQAAYADRITLFTAMETEYITSQSLDDAIALQRRHQLDYLVGSVHHVGGIPIDFSEQLYVDAIRKAGDLERLFCNYFDEQHVMLQKLKPRVVGHFDLVRLYRPDFPLSQQIWTRIRRNVDFIVNYGGLMEINSRALKKKLVSPYPLPEVLDYCITAGAKFTLSDDCHGPNDVGMHYIPLFTHLKTHQVKSIYSLQRKEGEIVEVQESNILEDPFWKQFTNVW